MDLVVLKQGGELIDVVVVSHESVWESCRRLSCVSILVNCRNGVSIPFEIEQTPGVW